MRNRLEDIKEDILRITDGYDYEVFDAETAIYSLARLIVRAIEELEKKGNDNGN